MRIHEQEFNPAMCWWFASHLITPFPAVLVLFAPLLTSSPDSKFLRNFTIVDSHLPPFSSALEQSFMKVGYYAVVLRYSYLLFGDGDLDFERLEKKR